MGKVVCKKVEIITSEDVLLKKCDNNREMLIKADERSMECIKYAQNYKTDLVMLDNSCVFSMRSSKNPSTYIELTTKD